MGYLQPESKSSPAVGLVLNTAKPRLPFSSTYMTATLWTTNGSSWTSQKSQGLENFTENKDTKLPKGDFLTQENGDDADWAKFQSQHSTFSKPTSTKLTQKAFSFHSNPPPLLSYCVILSSLSFLYTVKHIFQDYHLSEVISISFKCHRDWTSEQACN